MIRSLGLFSFFAAAMLASCTEQVDPDPYIYSKVFSGATSRTWRITQVFLREQGKADAEISLATCERDDRYVFYNNAERLYEVTNGSSACDETEPETLVSYTWSFANSSASLNIVIPHFFGNFIIPFIVKKATEKSLELEVFADEEGTISYVFYFEHVSDN